MSSSCYCNTPSPAWEEWVPWTLTLEELKVWLEATLPNLSAHSETARAVRYALGAWAALEVYCGDGEVEIDNNAVERELRAVASAARTIFSPAPIAAGRARPASTT